MIISFGWVGARGRPKFRSAEELQAQNGGAPSLSDTAIRLADTFNPLASLSCAHLLQPPHTRAGLGAHPHLPPRPIRTPSPS